MSVWHRITLNDALDPTASSAEIVHARGHAFDRGVIHGRHAAAKIRTNISILHRIIAQHPGVSRPDFDTLVTVNKRFATEQDPELADGVRGIARGSGLDEKDIWGLNLPAHFLLGRLSLECSQLFLGSDRATGPLLSKTRDFSATGAFKQTVLFSEYGDGSRSIAGHTSGSLTWPGSGITSAGLAYSTSGVWSERVAADPGHAESRWLLFNGEIISRGARSAREFARAAGEQPRAVGINLVVADLDEAYAVELTAEDARITPARHGRVIRTNHYETTDGEFGRIGPRPGEYENTYRREEFLRHSTDAHPEPWDLGRVRDLLESAPICREAEPGSESVSEYTSIADIASGAFVIKINP